jgi:hypothetical protein
MPIDCNRGQIQRRLGQHGWTGGTVMEANRLFWGKTFPELDGPRGKSAALYKPVLHHLIDVAAVASSYLRVQRTRLVREAALVAIAPHAYADLVGFLAGPSRPRKVHSKLSDESRSPLARNLRALAGRRYAVAAALAGDGPTSATQSAKCPVRKPVSEFARRGGLLAGRAVGSETRL